MRCDCPDSETDPELSAIIDRLEDVFDDLEGLPVYHRQWDDFLNTQKPIVVISTAADGIRKDSQLIDMLITNLYAWKQRNREQRMTVVLDEIEDLDLGKEGPIGTILRKGGKHRLSMLLATQEFSLEKDKLGKLIGNCGFQIIFRPKDADIRGIAKHLGCEPQMLAKLEQGEFVAAGSFFSRRKQKNCRAVIPGKAYLASHYTAFSAFRQEDEAIESVNSGDAGDESDTGQSVCCAG
jgi:hypothetical protein